MEGIAEQFRGLRQAMGKRIDEIAIEAGVEIANYCDLESIDDEFEDAISIEDVEKVCKALGTSARELCRKMNGTKFDGAKRILPDDLAGAIRLHIVSAGLSLPEFEEAVGWELEAFLANPTRYWHGNIRWLKDICAALGLDWIDALP
ncbi:MAG TPA: helix-turn-helix transcriptional regulator [Tepidisphaeraceae bacterium]|jgi:transcriptional regulator with XRE-family HTH domain|nr:helix-turn-helix transcriptional regulator [Tepidisphaeraceae bacterium]